jgi:DNA-directed RNA polymerase subunit RPC12/RpoP
MDKRVIKKCKNPKCKQSFGVTEFTKLFEDNRAKCPYCGFLNSVARTKLAWIKMRE